ncbi:hypothetical protein A2706_02315 [Candidatus Peribacteria bacterium RIFCSPHIGHO2_01_FULL_51_35]|nr:MAG: hypothetical protein A2706_02315 [Candidatus Peribacteria bacterium RIFCSPHIGHO2_01_FULL_51_35]
MRKLSWKQKAKIAVALFFHRKTPFAAKATIIGAILYGLMPLDIIPDILPVLGFADDATVLILAIIAFLHLTKSIRKEMANKKDIIDV